MNKIIANVGKTKKKSMLCSFNRDTSQYECINRWIIFYKIYAKLYVMVAGRKVEILVFAAIFVFLVSLSFINKELSAIYK